MSRVYTDEEILSIFSQTELHEGVKLSSWNWTEKVYEKIRAYCSDWAEGCSKGVIFLKDADFVIKIPFNTSDERNEMLDFTGAYNAHNYWDYCAVEEEKYELAKSKGVADCFLPVHKVGCIKGYPIYKQPIGQIFCQKNMKYDSTKIEKTTTKFYKTHNIPLRCKYRLPTEWIYDAILAYPPYLVVDLLSFIDNNVSDLHHANIGYYENNPVIIDYAGFDESEYSSSEEYYSNQSYI